VRINLNHHSSQEIEEIDCKSKTSCKCSDSESRELRKDIQNVQWQSDLSENNENHNINKRSDTSAMNSNYAWKHSLLKSHAEVALSDKACKSAWKWSNKQDDWRCIQTVAIADQASAYKDSDVTDTHTETDQIDMKNSLKREI